MNTIEPDSSEALTDSELIEQAIRLGARLKAEAMSAATAESCTGGWIAKTFTDIAGSSEWFNGGVVTYSNAVKERMLGVESEVLKEHGAVSEQVVRQMAHGALDAVGADCAVSVSGVAGPGGGTPCKPVGTVWIAAAIRRRGPLSPDSVSQNPMSPDPSIASGNPADVRVEARLHQFAGSRDEVRRASVAAAIELLGQVLDSD